MRSLYVLCKLSFRQLLNTFKIGRKKAGKGYAALLFLVGISLYISGIYSFLMADVLSSIGMMQYLMPIMAMVSGVMCFAYTMFASQGIVFSGKDADFMLSLPVSAFKVMLSRILALYLEDYIITLAMLVPAAVAYYVQGGTGGVVFGLLCFVGSLLLPFVVAVLALLVGFVTAFFSARLPKRALVESIFYMLFFGLFMLFYLQLGNINQFLLNNQPAVKRAFATWLLPYGLFGSMLNGSLLSGLALALLCVVPFLLLTYLFSTQYKKVLSMLASHALRTDYKVQGLKSSGQFAALLKKEIKRYFGTPIYFFNTGFGAVLLIGGSVFAVLKRAEIMALLPYLDGTPIAAVVLVGMAFALSTIVTTSVSLSLEGQYLWILKEAPIDVKTLFRAKIAQNLSVSWLAAVVSMPLLCFATGLGVASALLVLAVCLLFCLFNALFGLVVNLHLPKMDADNDTVVVKQSASAMVGIFGGMAFVLAGLLGYFFLGSRVDFAVFCLVLLVLLAALCAVLWRWLCTHGVRVFTTL